MTEPLHLFNIQLLDGESMGANITSNSINVQNAISYSVQFTWSGGGAPVGDLNIQASNDDVNFVSILDTPISVAANSGSELVNVEKHAYGYIRLVYTRTSGTASLDAHINAKRG